MGERWFTDEELHEMSRPTMDRAIEAIDRGDLDEARALCEAMKHEWRSLHDLMVEGVAGLISFVQDRLATRASRRRGATAPSAAGSATSTTIATMDRRAVAQALAATWRAHSGSGTGPSPGAFTITEDDEKLTFAMNPCGSGQRLVRNGRYEGDDAFGTTNEATTGATAARASRSTARTARS